MKQIELAYLPVIGRGEQINLICALHGIEVNYLLSSPMGEDFDKDTQAPFGIIPWMKDMSNGLELNDSMAIVQYLVAQYPGPLTPKNNEEAARVNMYWAWVQDYYSVPTPGRTEAINDPQGPRRGTNRVIRGSSWGHAGIRELRHGLRNFGSSSYWDVGFRIARNVE